MFRTITTLFAFALLLSAATISAAPDLKFDGKIVVSDKEKLVLLAGEQQHEFVLSKGTKITLNGQEAAATDLMAGQTAQVSAEREEARMKALSITAFSPK
jgi:hypothetical protein